MSTQDSGSVVVSTSASEIRHYANFHHSLRGNHFLTCASDHMAEQKRGHIPSAVECYMKQYGVSKEASVKVLNQQVENARKDLNEEFLLNPTAMFPLLQPNLNLSRGCNFVYKDGERYTNPHLMKDQVASLLKDLVML